MREGFILLRSVIPVMPVMPALLCGILKFAQGRIIEVYLNQLIIINNNCSIANWKMSKMNLRYRPEVKGGYFK